MTTTIRVSVQARDTLHELAIALGMPMQEVVEQAIENYHRQYLLEAANAAYAAVRADPHTWQEIETERAEWDVTLSDGLEKA